MSSLPAAAVAYVLGCVYTSGTHSGISLTACCKTEKKTEKNKERNSRNGQLNDSECQNEIFEWQSRWLTKDRI